MALSQTAIFWSIVLAAGQGNRFASASCGLPKQFLQWQGFPLYWHSARVMSKVARISGLILVFPADVLEEQQQIVADLMQADPLGIPVRCTSGGAMRQDSVRQGLTQVPSEATHVLVHDAARPFLSPDLVNRVCSGLEQGAKAVIPAMAITDTVKLCDGNKIVKTLDRSQLLTVQTPQGFEKKSLIDAHANAVGKSLAVTDDASLLEVLGEEVLWIPGDERNRKITQPVDMELLQKSPRPHTCVGMGYDVHRYGEGRPMKLGGVAIRNAPEIIAHSDGDVLLHALMDALLGCAGLGDIGQHFPDTDDKFDNISSVILLDKVVSLLQDAGIVICHIDATIIAQKPRLATYRQEIRANLARLLSLDEQHVNIKATTEEGLGFTGRLEGIKASVVATCEASV